MLTFHLLTILTVLNTMICANAIAEDKSPGTALELKPVFVRETQVGSGTYGAVSVLPIFASELGEGNTVSTTYNSDHISVCFLTNPTTTSTATMIIGCAGTMGSYNGELIERKPGAGIYQDADNGVVVALTPSSQTTSGTVGSELLLKATVPEIKWKSKLLTLTKTDRFTFQGGAPLIDVILSAALSTTAPNTIIASIDNERESQTFTETGPNTRVFEDAYHLTTLTISSISQKRTAARSQMHVIVSSKVMFPSKFSATLDETGAGTNQFSNYQRTIGSGVYSNPATDGQGVFYIQLSGTVSTDVIVQSGRNQITVAARLVAGKPGLLRSGKLVLIAPNDPFRDANIATLTVDPKATGDDAVNCHIKAKGNP